MTGQQFFDSVIEIAWTTYGLICLWLSLPMVYIVGPDLMLQIYMLYEMQGHVLRQLIFKALRRKQREL